MAGVGLVIVSLRRSIIRTPPQLTGEIPAHHPAASAADSQKHTAVNAPMKGPARQKQA
jgi:hypothetical protein